MPSRSVCLLVVLLPAAASAQDTNPFDQGQDEVYQIEDQLLQQNASQYARVYGFIEGRFEKSAAVPYGKDANGDTHFEKQPFEWGVPAVHLMVQGNLSEKYRYYLNLAAPNAGDADADVAASVRNVWMEAALLGDYLNVRLGKTYRRFGLYNEILDAVPTFIGIEPPELFDKDHLLLTRTTNFMVHGQAVSGDHTVAYALMTGNDERAEAEVPIGADLYYDFQQMLRVGTSFYTTGGKAAPLDSSSSPKGGVARWMSEDEFAVFGGYLQLKLAGLTAEAEYWRAPHKGTRDPDAVATLCDAGLNETQQKNFNCAAVARETDGALTAKAQQILAAQADYSVQTAYLRAGYAIETSVLEITPYAQYDFYSNPEIIREKDFGGDDEAGIADDGTFSKATLGVILRPDPNVALKVDGSTHIQDVNGASEMYPELRVSLSYSWRLESL